MSWGHTGVPGMTLTCGCFYLQRTAVAADCSEDRTAHGPFVQEKPESTLLTWNPTPPFPSTDNQFQFKASRAPSYKGRREQVPEAGGRDAALRAPRPLTRFVLTTARCAGATVTSFLQRREPQHRRRNNSGKAMWLAWGAARVSTLAEHTATDNLCLVSAQ